MMVKNLNVGKGLQAYRLYSQPSWAPVVSNQNFVLDAAEVHRIFLDRLVSESEKVARLAGPKVPCTAEMPCKPR